MALSIFQRTVTDNRGNIIPGASVAVRDMDGGDLVPIFDDRAGASPMPNPFTTDAEGMARFYTEPGEYQVTATSDLGSVTWVHVAIDGTVRADLADPAQGAEMVANQNGGTVQDAIDALPPTPQAFGAVLDGITDDTAALQDYADHLAALADSVVTNSLAAVRRPVFWIPPGNGAVISAPLSIAKNISVICDAPIWVSAAASANPAGGAWVDIGYDATTGNRQTRNCEFVLDVRRITLSNWASESDLGVRLNTAASKLWIKRIDKFARGVMTTAPYSVTTLGEFRDCQIGLDVAASDLDFTNQQLFLGGEFAVANGSNNGLPRYGIRATRGGFSSLQNSLVFINPSFELNKTAAGAAETRSFVIHDFWNVVARDVRTEGSDTVLAKLTGDTRWFQASILYGYEFASPVSKLLDDQSTYKIGNRAVIDGGDFDFLKANLVFDSGNLCDEATYYGFSGWHIKNMEVATNTDPATFQLYGGISSVDYKSREVTLGSAPSGVRINTKNAKTFAVIVDGPSSKNINLAIVVFDSNGNQLIANTDVLQNQPTPTNSPNTGVYGGLYSLTTALDGDRQSVSLTFSPGVATAFIGLSGGVVRSLKIYAVNGLSDYFSKSTLLGKNARLARAVPISGAYTRGQQITNTEVAAAGSPGWAVTTTGQFGTLSSVTAITTSGSRTVTVNDATNLWVGCAITISGVTGTKIIEALEGVVAFVDSNCDATVSGAAVAYVAPVFKSMPAVAA